MLNPVTANDEIVNTPEVKFSIAPNPFRDNAGFNFVLVKQNQPVELAVYNVKGQLIKSIYKGTLKGNKLNASWDGFDAAGHKVKPGIYFIKANSGSYNRTFKLLKI